MPPKKKKQNKKRALKQEIMSIYEESEEEEEEEDEEIRYDPNNPDSVFVYLEHGFNKVMAEMEDNPAINKYVEPFSAVFDFLYHTREHSAQLIHDIDHLKEQLNDTETELTNNQQILAQDDIVVTTLKDDIEKTHMRIDEAHAREQAAQEVIDNLRKTICNLNAEIDFKNKMGEGEEEEKKVAKHRQGIQRENAKLIVEVTKLNEKLDTALVYQEQLEHRADVTDVQIHEVSGHLDDTAMKVEILKRNKEKLDADLEEFYAEIGQKNDEIEAKAELVNRRRKSVINLDTEAKEKAQIAIKCFKEIQTINTKYSKLQNECDTISYQLKALNIENYQAKSHMRAKITEQNLMLLDLKHLTVQRINAENNQRAMQERREQSLKEREALRKQLVEMELAIMEQKKAKAMQKRQMEGSMRTRDIIRRNLAQQQEQTTKTLRLIKTQKRNKALLVTDIESHIGASHRYQKQVNYLERERERLLEEAQEQNKKMEEGMELVRTQKANIFELQRDLAEFINRLRMQQNLYDAVCADKHALEKSYTQLSSYTTDLKTKFHSVIKLNGRLKNDITIKSQMVVKGDMHNKKIIKDRDNMRSELGTCIDEITDLKQDMQWLRNNERFLHSKLKDNQRTIREQNKTVAMYVNEREVLGAQFVRRNAELRLLYDKCTILQTSLHCGGQQYAQRLNDIKLLKFEIKRLRQENLLLTKTINNMNDLKQEVFFLDCDLNTERLKCEMLAQELKRPLNIHHWRKLEGSEPEVLTMLKKITLLQKRILKQSEEYQRKEKLLKEAETILRNYSQVVSKQLGPTIYERLELTKSALEKVNEQARGMQNEYNLMNIEHKCLTLELQKSNNAIREYTQQLILAKRSRLNMDQLISDFKKDL